MPLNKAAQTRESEIDKQQNSADVTVVKRSNDNSNDLSDNELIQLVSIISAKDTRTIALKYFGITKVFIDDAEFLHRDVNQFKFEIFTHWRNKCRPSRKVGTESNQFQCFSLEQRWELQESKITVKQYQSPLPIIVNKINAFRMGELCRITMIRGLRLKTNFIFPN